MQLSISSWYGVDIYLEILLSSYFFYLTVIYDKPTRIHPLNHHVIHIAFVMKEICKGV